ncbi:MAG: glycosyltransferase family 39 protein [Candidatus Omnitrophica bacterium]|nr:glycosyltransferase family 39 protein [Candidatus Omnitrophota bacterium]
MSKKKIKYICLILFGCLAIFHIANNLYFLTCNPLAEGKDSYAHITGFSNFKRILENKQNNPFYRTEKSLGYNLVFGVIDYPPLFYLSAYLMNLLLGSLLVNPALFTNTFYLIMLLSSVYAIAGTINARAAIISAFICGMYPLVFLSSRHFSLELALSAVTALSIFLLIKTNGFEQRKFSLLLGIFLGLGMLLKQTFLIYLSGPMIFYIYLGLFQKQPLSGLKKRGLNLCLSIIIGILISSIFYYNPEVYASVFKRAGFSGAVNNENLFSFAHLSYYFQSLPNTIGGFFLLMLLGGLFYLRKIERRMKYVLILWVLVPLIFFTFVRLKYGEYTTAYLAALSLITGLAITKIDRKFLSGLVIAVIIIIGVFDYYQISTNENRNFYATYYPSVPILAVAYPENKSQSAAQILENIAFSQVKIGIFYDSNANDLVFPAYFVRLTGLSPRKKAQIVDFSFCPDVFWKTLDDFDRIIFITYSDQQWITNKSFNEFVKQMNEKNPNQLKVKQSDIIRLVALNENLDKTDKIVLNKLNPPENIYIYKRKK